MSRLGYIGQPPATFACNYGLRHRRNDPCNIGGLLAKIPLSNDRFLLRHGRQQYGNVAFATSPLEAGPSTSGQVLVISNPRL